MVAERIAVLGAGRMAEALVAGWTAAGVPPAAIAVTNRSDDARLARLAERYGVRVTRDRRSLVHGASVLVVAVKPADVPAALAPVRERLAPDVTVVSVAAGVRLRALRALLGDGPGVVRAMPNTACRVRQAATALAAEDGDGPALERARRLFAPLGAVVTVPEEQLDAVTALSGSGPAYVYLLAEAMEAAARDLGLDPAVARQLVAATILGAGRMLLEEGADPAALRAQVTSPRGTTAAALEVLMGEADLPGAVRRAVLRAAARAAELARLA